MVYVDLSNPAVRRFIPQWLKTHEARLDALRARLPQVAQAAAALESERPAPARRPLAAVFDIDELLLCNIHENEHTLPGGGVYRVIDFFPPGSRAEGAWPEWGVHCVSGESPSPPYPGAVGLVGAAREAGLEVFFVSGRRERLRGETAHNLRGAGLCGRAGEIYLLPDDWDLARHDGSVRPFKTGCRTKIENTHRVAINVGDQLSDLGEVGDEQVLCPHPFYHTP